MVKSNKHSEKNEDEYDEFDSDIGDDEIDEELALPSVLSGITYDEKRELLRFKHDHNEIDWEKEILRRSDLLARKIDMERLKSMSKGTNNTTSTKDIDIAISKGKQSKRSSVVVKQTGVKGIKPVSKPISDSDEYSEEEDGEVEDDDIAADDDNDDDDDELFDSEEEEEISKRVLNEAYEDEEDNEEEDEMVGSKRKTTKETIILGNRRSTRRTTAAKKSSYDLDDDDDDEEKDAYDSEEELYGKRSNKSKDMNVDVDYNLRLLKDKKSKVLTKHSNSDVLPLITTVPIMGIDEDDLDLIDGKEDDSPLAGLEDYLRLQTKRDMIIKWLNEPYLKAAVIGTFVKYLIGSENDQTIYRMCQVVDVDLNSKPYKSQFLPGEQITARLTISFAGNSRKFCRIDGVSNSRIAEHELDYFLKCHAKSKKSNFKPLTINKIERQRERILKSFKSHVYTTDEINNMVARNSGLDKSLVTEFTTAMDSLNKRLIRAREVKDYESLETIQKTIDRLQKQHDLQKEIFDRATKRQVIVNRKMKEGNTLRDMEAGMRKRQEDLEAAASGKLPNSVTDPFIRRDTRPKILWNTGKKMESILQSKEKEEGKGGDDKITTLGNKDTNIQEIDMTNDESIQINSSSYNDQLANNELSLVIKWKKVDEYALTLDQIRKRVKQRLGVDPYYEAKERTHRDRYLSRVCVDLPPIDSEDRIILRGSGITLKEFIVHTQDIDTEMMQT